MIELPEDRTTKIFVLQTAANFALTNFVTSLEYELEIKDQQITSLSRMSRDMHKSYNERLAAEKRERGLIDDVSNESRLTSLPNWTPVVVMLFVGALILAYGQYTGQINAWELAIQENEAAIFVVIILVFALFIFWRFGRRRKA